MNGGTMCYGDGDMDRPVAFVQCNMAKLAQWADAEGISYNSMKQLAQLPAAKKAVLDDLLNEGKRGGLSPIELLAAVVLLTGEGEEADPVSLTSKWTPENGALTATRKLNRNTIKGAMETEFNTLKAAGI